MKLEPDEQWSEYKDPEQIEMWPERRNYLIPMLTVLGIIIVAVVGYNLK